MYGKRLGLADIISDSVVSTKNVFIFCLGRELLEGSVLDRNGNFMAKCFDKLAFRARLGLEITEVLDSDSGQSAP